MQRRLDALPPSVPNVQSTWFAMMENIFEIYNSKNIVLDRTHTIVKKELISNLLKGDPTVQQYIAASKHFK
jgi:preprotein translocase subunit SecA